MTIIEFLEARIAEDEAVARAAIRSGDGTWTAGEQPDPDGDVYDPCGIYGDDIHIYDEGGHDENHADHIARHDPSRVLAECAAKRAIIALDEYAEGSYWDTLATLAAVYASHPDYRQEWAIG